MRGVRSTQRHLYGTSAPTRDLAQYVRTGDERDAYDALAGGAALHRTAEGNEVRDAREIEAMRDELRKSILGLPHETAEGAAQMRRVIVDQIEALAELNRIV